MSPGDCIVKVHNSQDGPKPMSDYLAYDNYILQRGKMAGHCTVCGQVTLFNINTSPQLREELDCPNCKCFNRIRQLVVALAVINNVKLDKDLTLHKIFKKIRRPIRILLLEEVTPIAAWFDLLAREFNFELYKSEFLDTTMKSGEFKNNIMHLDIMNTHFPDNFFDLIVHAEVFEHVPNAPKAEKEQYRILKPKGNIVYTAPTYASLSQDDVRTTMSDDGKLIKLKEPIHHGDPSPGTLGEAGSIVFRFFSYQDVRTRYVSMGADYRCLHVYAPLFGIVGQENYVHLISKP